MSTNKILGHNRIMTYFNYHAKIKKMIKENKLIECEVVNTYHNISPALLLKFNNGEVYPIRQYRWTEYFDIINNQTNNI